MKNNRSSAVEILVLLAGSFAFPATTSASYYYGPSGALAAAGVADTGGYYQLAYCNTGFVPSGASCNSGSVLGYSTTGDAYFASAMGSAALANGDLSVNASNAGASGINAGAGVQINDTVNFHGYSAGQTGQLTMTAIGTSSGDSVANESLTVHFTFDFYTQFGYAGNGPWVNNTIAYTNHPGSTCYSPSALPTVACQSSDGQNLMVSVTFPLTSDGIYFEASMTGQISGDGAISYTDPFTLTLPAGVTFSSASGEFLTQPLATAAPEPSSALLAGIVVAGILGLRLRRRNSLCP